MAERLSRVQAAEAVARRWNEVGIPFLVAHGLEGYPDRLGRDLDILMNPIYAGRSLQEARRILIAAGWSVFVCPPRLWGSRLVALAPGEERLFDYLELHTIAGMAWLVLPVLTAGVAPGSWVGPFPMDPWTTFAKGILLPLLGGETAKFTSDYLESTLEVLGDLEALETPAAKLLGPQLGDQLLTAVANADPERLVSLRSRLRQRCLLQMAARPWVSVRETAGLVRRKAGRLVSRTGLRVRLTTPAGIDPRAFAQRVADEIDHIFVTVRLEPPAELGNRLRQQAEVLSRQGLVLEFASGSPDAPITAARLPRLRRSGSSHAFLEEGWQTREVASWIVEQWARSWPCEKARTLSTPPEN